MPLTDSRIGLPDRRRSRRLGGVQYHRRVLPVVDRPDTAEHELHNRRLWRVYHSLPFILLLPAVWRAVLVHRPCAERRR